MQQKMQKIQLKTYVSNVATWRIQIDVRLYLQNHLHSRESQETEFRLEMLSSSELLQNHEQVNTAKVQSVLKKDKKATTLA